MAKPIVKLEPRNVLNINELTEVLREVATLIDPVAYPELSTRLIEQFNKVDLVNRAELEGRKAYDLHIGSDPKKLSDVRIEMAETAKQKAINAVLDPDGSKQKLTDIYSNAFNISL